MKISRQILTFCILMCFGFLSFSQTENQKISMEDLMLNGTFSQKSVQGLLSMKDGIHYTTLEEGGTKIVKYSYATGKVVDTLLNLNQIKDVEIKSINEYEFSADESRILLMTNPERIYRRSFTADYFVFSFKNRELVPLSKNGKQRLATFSPNGNRIAFVRDNNLYIHNVLFGSEIRITKDGEWNKIQNGTPDWVYEEEFEFNRAFEWSPDSEFLAYMKFNEGDVKMFNMNKFEGLYPQIKENALYPENYTYKYPKAGEKNSTVEVFVYNIEDRITKRMDVGEEKDQYIPRIKWTQDPKMLSIYRLNRHQNKLELLLANARTGSSNIMYTQENKYYIEEGNFDYLTYLNDGKHFIYLDEKDGFNHLYLYDMATGKSVQQITNGDWDVTDFLGFDEKNQVCYYQSAEVSPMDRNVYSVKLNGTAKKLLTPEKGTNNTVFSNGFKYYINYFSSVTQPNTVSLFNSKGKMIRVLESNDELVAKLKEYQYLPKEFTMLPAADGMTMLNAWMIKPFNFDPSKKYPVVMTQYSGPNSQSVLNSWSFDWYQYLAQEGYVVVCVDPRGTGARGQMFRKCTYMQLGRLESDDQISAARSLAKESFIDENRIAIWGWSYGGFMSTLCLEKGSDVFAAAIAVAPVTNWRYYDSVYTERFMRTPQENPKGYDDNSPINHVDKLKGSLLLCHGTADDNVHIQNTYELTERLVQADKQFEMQVYTNRNHSIYGGKTRLHLYNRFNKFLKVNL
ncbi:prolyl oligopeptidase family serine peptidase [Labilibaculum sp. A4]|uniref:S9 family peptidase n=1 Tax=Labilibaculum euxinus TaxID=2686357 RepID=UPI000F61A012|nr:S9 family peptidase [Labilibaculum euxinus]MDQ1769376.1 S9 family peptidase [Labilibaculum euxinus]MWN74902.1 prolyl oligopeptidase family serine peptidase [Labilibaculum euxinus]